MDRHLSFSLRKHEVGNFRDLEEVALWEEAGGMLVVDGSAADVKGCLMILDSSTGSTRIADHLAEGFY